MTALLREAFVTDREKVRFISLDLSAADWAEETAAYIRTGQSLRLDMQRLEKNDLQKMSKSGCGSMTNHERREKRMKKIQNIIKYNRIIYLIYFYVMSFLIRFMGMFIKIRCFADRYCHSKSMDIYCGFSMLLERQPLALFSFFLSIHYSIL